MILIDLSSVVLPEVIQLVTKEKESLSDDLVRRVVVSQVFNYKVMFSEYGKPVICSDARSYWRRDLFPHYKQNRKKYREEHTMDWNAFYIIFNRIKEEMKDLPYRFIEIDKLEADDVIAVLAKRYSQVEPIMIVSADKDLIQLQIECDNVFQYSPMTKKRVVGDEKDYSLIEHIIRGDRSDGIPNIFSDDDVFMDDNKRQKRISRMIVEEAKKLKNPELISPNGDVLNKYKRNKTLIDLNEIPQEYRMQVVESFENPSVSMKRTTLLNYAIKHKLRNIINKYGVINR
jgi:5'-3' exonuclease